MRISQNKLVTFFGKENRLLVVTLAFLLTFSFATYVFATPPTSPYTPGETNDPSCVPGGTNCYVVIAGTGTVTSFSANDLSPLFTSSVASSTTTPALSFELSDASAYTIFGNNSGSSTEPAFFTPTLASALFQNQGTTTTVLHGNASGNPSWSQIVNADIANGTIDISTKVTGTLSTDNGGTGLSSLGTSNQILGVNNAGNALEYKTISTSGTAVSSDVGVTLSGANAIVINLPSASATVRGVLTTSDWSTFNSKMTSTLADGSIFVGNGSNIATAVALSGDATMTNAGVLTIGNSAITTAKINNAAVTYAKFNNVAATSLVGNATGSSATATDIGVGGALTFSGSTLTSAAPTSIGTIDSAPSGKHANGLRIESNVLYAQNADATYPGLVSTGTQTFAGAKTFNGAITASGGLSAGSNVISSVATPSTGTDAANKSYVDGLVNGLKWKVSVNAATTTTLPSFVYDPGFAGVGAYIEGSSNGAIGAIDGVTLGASDRLLVKNETGGNEPYNGIYIVTTVGDGSTKYKLTRCTTCDEPAEFTNTAVAVLAGTVNAGTAWTQTNTVTTVGTDPVAWAQFLSNAYTEGTGIDITSGSISVDFSTVTGTLGVAHGGTGLSSGTSGGILYYSGSGTLASSGALTQYALVLGGGAGGAPSTPLGLGTSGQCLTSQGAGSAPTWSSTCSSAGTVTSISIGSGLTGSSNPLVASGSISLDLTNANIWTGLQSFSITNTATSGSVFGLKIMPTYNQASGTAANTDLFINRTETAVGSGAQNLIDAQVGGTSKFKVSNTGLITATGGLTSAGTTTLSALSTGILHANSSGVLSSSAVALASDVSGTLPVANGGTGLTSGTSGGVLYYSGSGTLASSGALTANSIVLGGGAGATPTTPLGLGTSGQCLLSQGAGLAPQWTSCPGGSGISSIGTINSQTKSSNGLVISGSTLVAQTADASNVGLVSTGTQTFAGTKTFDSDIKIHSGSDTITAGWGNGSVTTNTVFGTNAGSGSNTGSGFNNWFGYQAGSNNTSGVGNVGIGFNAGKANTSGGYNVAIGDKALSNGVGLSSLSENVVIGASAGNVLASGSYNTIVGTSINGLTSGSRNILIGVNDGGGTLGNYGGDFITTGSGNVFIGAWNNNSGLLTNAVNNTIVLSDGGTGTAGSASLRMIIDSTGQTNFGGDTLPNDFFTVGATSQFRINSSGAITQAAGITSSGSIAFTGLSSGAGSTAVCISGPGFLSTAVTSCTVPSALRFKTDVETMTGTLSQVKALRPVSYTSLVDSGHYVGFIAEEVATVENRLVSYDENGQVMGLNYAQFAPLFAGAIQELDIKFETLSSIDVSQSGSLASLITNFLKDAVIEIKDATIGTLRVKNEVCVDDVCVTKDQFKTLLQNAGGSGTSGGGGGSTTTTGTEDDGSTTTETETGTTGGEEDTTTTGEDSGTTTGEETETTGEDTGTTGGDTDSGGITGEETGTTGESTTGTGTTDGGTTDGTSTGTETGTTGESTTGTGTTDGGTTDGTSTGTETGTTTGE